MRTVALVYFGGIASLYLIAVLSAIIMRSSYAEMLETGLEDAMTYSVMMCQDDRDVWISSYSGNKALGSGASISWDSTWDDTEAVEKFKQSFVESLSESLKANIKGLDIEFYGADEEYGLLSVKATAKFQYPWLTYDEVTRTRTVILDRVFKQ